MALFLVEHRAPGQIGGPRVLGHEFRHHQGGEQAVTKFPCDLVALGPQRGDQDRHECARAQADALGALRGERQGHPYVRALLRRVVDPCPVIAELLGRRDVVRRVQGGRERA